MKAHINYRAGFALGNAVSSGVLTVIITVLWMGFPSLAQAVIDDPVAYWSFDDSPTGLENQVTPGPYHDADVLTGNPAFGLLSGEAGIVGNSMVLDGASAIALPYHQDNLGSSFTIAMWYWQSTNDTRMALYQTKDNWDASYEATGNNSSFASYVGQAGAGAVITELKTWVHLVHSFSTVGETTTLSVYTNGVLALTPKSVSSNTMFNALQIRRIHVGSYRGYGRYFKGMIDELALWNRALSAAEAAALCQQGRDGLDLGVISSPSPRIDLQNSQWSYIFNTDDDIGGGVYQSGWLANGIQDVPLVRRLEDTAARLDDTAGHADGPFHAEALDPKFKIPITTGLSNITLGDFTLETRFRTTDAARGVLIGNYTYTNSSLSTLNLELLDANRVRFYFRKPPAAPFEMQISAGSINTRDGAWHHLAGTRKGSTMYLYLDGQEVGQIAETNGSFLLEGSEYFLKGDSRNDATIFIGDMEDARLWTRALTTNEVTALATGAVPGDGTVASSNMLAQYTGMYSPHDATYASPRHSFKLVKPLTYMTRTNFTMETWFRSTSTERGVLIGSYPSQAAFGCVNLEVSSDRKCRLYIQPYTTGYSPYSLYTPANQNIRDGEWHHLAGVRRDGSLYLYLDGQQKAVASDPTCSFDLTAPYMYLGRDARTGTTEYDGDLKAARLWSRALTASEITSIVAGKKPGDAEVAIDGFLTEHTTVSPPWTNTLAEAGYDGSRFLRTYIAGINKLSLEFENLPPHKEIALGALLSQLDSLDPVQGNDYFALKVDGTELLNVGLGPDSDDEPQVNTFTLFGQSADVQLMKDAMTLGGENLFYCGSGDADYNEHVYDLSLLDALQTIPHTGDTLLVELIADQDAYGDAESFGVDQIELTVIPLKGTLILVF